MVGTATGAPLHALERHELEVAGQRRPQPQSRVVDRVAVSLQVGKLLANARIAVAAGELGNY